MLETQTTENLHTHCDEQRNGFFYSAFILVILIGIVASISGCQYYSDSIRQQNLCKDLSRHYIFQQTPSTVLNPAQYHLCGDNCYPCKAYTAWGTSPRYFYKAAHHYRHHHIKHKVLKKAVPKDKVQTNSTSNKEIKNIKNSLMTGDIFLSPLKPSS